MNGIQKVLRSSWLSNSAKILKNIAKKSKGIDDKKKELNQFLQFLFINSNSNSFYSIPFQFQFLELTPALHTGNRRIFPWNVQRSGISMFMKWVHLQVITITGHAKIGVESSHKLLFHFHASMIYPSFIYLYIYIKRGRGVWGGGWVVGGGG